MFTKKDIPLILLCLLMLTIIMLPTCSRMFARTIAGSSVKGFVKDKNNHPLPGAVIQIPDLKTGTVTDSNGYFMINNLPNGNYIIVAGMISYATTSKSITINGITQADFILSESAIEGHEIVITGQSKATEIRRSPIPILAINHDYLMQNSFTNIIDAMAKVPGIATVSTGPNVCKPFIRGLGYNRILTLFGGMRQEGQQWGDEHGIEVDEYNVDRIEVVKGPASLIYGSDALAGVVNLIPVAPAPDGKTIGNVTSEYQGNNGLIGLSAMLSGNKKGFYWSARLSDKQAKDYRDKIDGSVYGTNFRETDASASLGINRKWGYSHLDFSLFNDLQAIPDGSRDSATRQFTKQITEADTFRPIISNHDLNTYAIPVIHQLVQHYRLMSSNSFNVGNGRLAVNLGFERSVRREYSHPEYADIPGLYMQLNTYTYDVKYYLAEFHKWDITLGLNGMYQTNDVTHGTDFVIPSYHQFDVGPFIVAKKTFGNIDITGGVRYDSRTFNNDALYTRPDPVTGFDQYVSNGDTAGADHHFSKYGHTFSGATGSIGATYSISSHVFLKINIARGFRAPNIAEISANGIHPGTNIYQLGNANFKPEFSLQEDIGLDWITPNISANAAVFNNTITNYIYNQKLLNSNGQDSIIVPGNQTFQFVAATAQLYGGEARIDIHPYPFYWLHFENSISVVYAINKDVSDVGGGSKYLPFIPPIHGISELRANLKKPSKALRNSFIKVQLAIYAKQDRAYTAYNTETPTPAYTLFNAGIGTEIVNHAGKTVMSIAVFGNNLFDVAYQDHLSRLKYFEQYPNDPRGISGIYNMGRNIGLKLAVPLNF